MHQSPQFIVVIGASAVGLQDLVEIVTQLDTNINAAYCVALHVARTEKPDQLSKYLQKFTSLSVQMAEDGTEIKKGCVYVAPPGKHLLVTKDKLELGYGPHENRWRPSIDVLFRSAAVAYKGCAIGVMLSGLMDDGTAGMKAIERCGGSCIVQDPAEVEFAEMPRSVSNTVTEEVVSVRLAEIAKTINDIIQNKVVDDLPVPEEIIAEAAIALKIASGVQKVEPLGERSPYSCPDCGGSLWHLTDEDVSRYRCQIGHEYSEKDLIRKQAEASEASLWVAVRILEERKHLYLELEGTCKKKNWDSAASQFVEKANNLQQHIDKLKTMIGEQGNGATDLSNLLYN